MTQPIRVLHVIDSLDAGGAQAALFNLVRHCDTARFEPSVATMHGRGVLWDDFARLGVPLHSLSPRRELPLYVPRFAGIVRSLRPQIVHCHLYGSNWVAKPLAAALGVPVRISHDHCSDALRYENQWARAVDAQANRFSSHICAVSGSIRDFLLRQERISGDRISLVYSGVDLDRFRAFTGKSRPVDAHFTVLGVGRLMPQKGFTAYLKVAALLLSEGCRMRFQIAGAGPNEEVLRMKAAALGISASVEFLGHVDDMPNLYGGADALLVPSRFRGTPMAVLEAMAMRLPIVASRMDGLAEVLVEDTDALLASPGDIPAFARQLRRLVDEPGLDTRLADSALKKVRDHFSARAMISQVEGIYGRCLEEAADRR